MPDACLWLLYQVAKRWELFWLQAPTTDTLPTTGAPLPLVYRGRKSHSARQHDVVDIHHTLHIQSDCKLWHTRLEFEDRAASCWFTSRCFYSKHLKSTLPTASPLLDCISGYDLA